MTLTVVLIAAYLLGSIPTSYIVAYHYTGRDIRTMGNGNPGTMNVLDTVGAWPALIVAVGDITKGMAAVGIAYLAGLDDVDAVLAALVTVVGHDYSLFLRLNGGNGMATAVGAYLALLPVETLIAASLAIAIWLATRSRRSAGLIGLAALPGLAFWFHGPDAKLIGVGVLLAVTVVKIFRFEGFSPARARSDR